MFNTDIKGPNIIQNTSEQFQLNTEMVGPTYVLPKEATRKLRTIPTTVFKYKYLIQNWTEITCCFSIFVVRYGLQTIFQYISYGNEN